MAKNKPTPEQEQRIFDALMGMDMLEIKLEDLTPEAREKIMNSAFAHRFMFAEAFNALGEELRKTFDPIAKAMNETFQLLSKALKEALKQKGVK